MAGDGGGNEGTMMESKIGDGGHRRPPRTV